MAISFVAAANDGLPAGLAEGHIMICGATANNTGTFTWPAGWTEIAVGNQGAARRIEVRWKRAGASESAPTITPGGGTLNYAIAAYDGCIGTGSPVDQVSSVASGSNPTINWNAITPTVADTEVCFAVGSTDGIGIASPSGSNPTSPSQRYKRENSGTGTLTQLWSGAKNDTSSTGSRTSTSGGSGFAYNTVVFNLLPASTQTLAANSISSGETVYQPSLSNVSPQVLAANLVTSSGSVFQPALTNVPVLAPNFISGGSLVFQPSLTGVPPEAAPPMDYSATVPTTPTDFQDRWATGQHIGDIAPRMVVEVRRGRWRRERRTVTKTVDADIYGETATTPWITYWDPAEDWIEVPGIAEYNETQSFEENGCQVVTLTMDNVRFEQDTGGTGLTFHDLVRGFASPTRGYVAPGRPVDGWVKNEWYDRLSRMAQIRVWQGYGDPVRGTEVNGSTMPTDGGDNGMWVFMGQIDDIDPDVSPDRSSITISCRNGQPLTDQEFFGWNVSPTVKEPIVFADRATYEDDPDATRWVLVDDVAEIVKVVLRWAGYLDMGVEPAGVEMKGHKAYNRQNMLVEVINDICEQTGYTFTFSPPIDGESLALPVFRDKGARDAAPVGMVEIEEDGLLLNAGYKQSMEPLAYILRVRGKKTSTDTGGVTLGEDESVRLMAVYRPPWSYMPGDPDLKTDRLAGELKHVTETVDDLTTYAECLTFAKLWALNMALEEVQTLIEIPGHPGLLLNGQVGVTDSTLAVNSRLWVAARSSTFTTGENTSWKTTLTGPLLDFPDVAAMLEELEA